LPPPRRPRLRTSPSSPYQRETGPPLA
jgi:hypothetical protein